jgi:hypothetical protein
MMDEQIVIQHKHNILQTVSLYIYIYIYILYITSKILRNATEKSIQKSNIHT